jgi:hypothetical protein
VIIPITLTWNPSWTLPNQISYLNESSIKSFTLGLLLKIDFTRTVEHTLTTARELADLQISLNTLSKHYGILYWILTKYKPRAIYYRLTKNLILINFGLWQVPSGQSLSCVPMVFCDRLSRIMQLFPKQDCVRTAWPSIKMVNAVTPFRIRKGDSEFSWTLGSVGTYCHVIRTSARTFPISVFWNPNSCRTWSSLT